MTPFVSSLPIPRLDGSTETDGDVLIAPEIDEPGSTGDGFRVIIYNDDVNDMDAVIEQIMKATQCTPEQAVQITLEAHSKGRAVCYRGDRAKCHQVTRVLREIRLQCEVDCD